MDMACSLGCFVCGNRGDGPATGSNEHDPSCCRSTRCNTSAWNRQLRSWLKAETKHKQGVAKWLLAEQLYQQQCETWLAAEANYAEDCQVWLRAQAQFRATLRGSAVKRVRVQAAPATPQTAKIRAHAR